MQNLTRRSFTRISATVAASTLGLVLSVSDLRADAANGENQTNATPSDTRSVSLPTQDDKLRSEFLFDLNLEAETTQNLGSAAGGRLIVPVSGGTFAGHGLKGTVVAPGGDWIVQRPDGSRVLDVRILLQTEDRQKIYMSWRGMRARERLRINAELIDARHKQRVVWLILAEWLQRVARLCCGDLCSSGIAVKALRPSQQELVSAFVELRSKVELSLPGLQQADGFIVIPLKSQLSHLDSEGICIGSLRVYF